MLAVARICSRVPVSIDLSIDRQLQRPSAMAGSALDALFPRKAGRPSLWLTLAYPIRVRRHCSLFNRVRCITAHFTCQRVYVGQLVVWMNMCLFATYRPL